MLTDNEIEELAKAVARAIASEPGVAMTGEEPVRASVRQTLRSLREQDRALEAEATAMLRAHGREVMTSQMDFQRLVADAKKIIARKKGIPL